MKKIYIFALGIILSLPIIIWASDKKLLTNDYGTFTTTARPSLIASPKNKIVCSAPAHGSFKVAGQRLNEKMAIFLLRKMIKSSRKQ